MGFCVCSVPSKDNSVGLSSITVSQMDRASPDELDVGEGILGFLNLKSVSHYTRVSKAIHPGFGGFR